MGVTILCLFPALYCVFFLLGALFDYLGIDPSDTILDRVLHPFNIWLWLYLLFMFAPKPDWRRRAAPEG